MTGGAATVVIGASVSEVICTVSRELHRLSRKCSTSRTAIFGTRILVGTYQKINSALHRENALLQQRSYRVAGILRLRLPFAPVREDQSSLRMTKLLDQLCYRAFLIADRR